MPGAPSSSRIPRSQLQGHRGTVVEQTQQVGILVTPRSVGEGGTEWGHFGQALAGGAFPSHSQGTVLTFRQTAVTLCASVGFDIKTGTFKFIRVCVCAQTCVIYIILTHRLHTFLRMGGTSTR